MYIHGPRALRERLRPLLCTLWLLAPVVWVAGPPMPAPAYSPHAPIQIISNADFTVPNGVVRGSGTATDPYVIEGWEIAPTGSHGINIQNTDRFFVIRDVYVHGAPLGYVGVWLGLLSNGRVEDSLFTDNWGAAFGTYVTNVTFARNNVTGNLDGLGVLYSGNVSFLSNNASDNLSVGIGAAESTEVGIVGNILAGNHWGVLAQYRTEAVVRGNEIRANTGVGVSLYQQSLGGSVAVYENRIVGNAVQAEDDGPGDRWDDSYPSGGNFWSDYTGVDDCSGPNQDVCPDPDGIGDTPYAVDADSADRYPLMDPGLIIDRPPQPPRIVVAELAGAGLVDVRLSWLPSPDDGGGEFDVDHYETWAGDAYNPTGVSYVHLATLPRGASSYVHAGAGAGDTSSRFYELRVVDAGNQTSAAVLQAGKFTRSVAQGYNLLSVPLDQSDWNLTAILRTIPWTHARTFVNDGGPGVWLSHIVTKPYATLTTLDLRTAVWVNASADSWFVVAGLVPVSTDISLREGWNLIGYPGLLTGTVGQVLASVSYRAVEGFAPAPPYHLRSLTPTDGMVAGEGYWIWALVPAVITIDNR